MLHNICQKRIYFEAEYFVTILTFIFQKAILLQIVYRVFATELQIMVGGGRLRIFHKFDNIIGCYRNHKQVSNSLHLENFDTFGNTFFDDQLLTRVCDTLPAVTKRYFLSQECGQRIVIYTTY